MNILTIILAIIFGTIYLSVLGHIILFPVVDELRRIAKFFETFEVKTMEIETFKEDDVSD